MLFLLLVVCWGWRRCYFFTVIVISLGEGVCVVFAYIWGVSMCECD